MLHIANIIEEGKLGGPQVYMMLLAQGLIGQAMITTVIPEENSEAFQNQCRNRGLILKITPLTRITKELKPALRYLLLSGPEVIRLILYFRAQRFDIVYSAGGSWQYKGVIAGKLARKKVLWHLNDTSMPYLFRKLFSLFSHLTDGYIFASERSKKYYGSIGQKGKPEFVIPAPVDVEHFDPVREYETCEKETTRWQGKVVIGTVANINPIKGLELFIQTAAQLNTTHSANLVFVIIGAIYPRQESYFQRLQSLCNELCVENIEFVGSRSDIRPLLKRFDIYVCSSLAESSPISVWEAMAMEKPVVSTDVGDVPVYIENGINGYIVDVGDSEAMANRIGSLLQDDEKRAVFGQRARRVAAQELDVSKCAARHLEAYRAVME